MKKHWRKLEKKLQKKISTQIAASAVNYDNLKLQISKDKKLIAEYYARTIAGPGAAGGTLGTANIAANLAIDGYGKKAIAAGVGAGLATTAITTAVLIGGRAIYALIQKKRYDELCVIKLTGEKTNKNGEKKEKCLGIWLTIKLSRNDLDPSVRSKVKII